MVRALFVARKWKQALRSSICFQAGVHEQNVKSRSDDGCEADGFASEAKPPQVEASTAKQYLLPSGRTRRCDTAQPP